MPKSNHVEDRGQGFIFDAIVGGAILIASLALVIYSTGLPPAQVTNPSENTIEPEVKKDVEAVLEASEQDGTLKNTVLSWKNGSEADGFRPINYEGSLPAFYYTFINYPNNEFGERLKYISQEHDVNVNVIITPHSNASAPDQRPESIVLVTPNTEQVSFESDYGVSKTIELHDSDTLRSVPMAHNSHSGPIVSGATGKKELGELSTDDTYIIPEGDEDVVGDRTYNRIDVKVMVNE